LPMATPSSKYFWPKPCMISSAWSGI